MKNVDKSEALTLHNAEDWLKRNHQKYFLFILNLSDVIRENHIISISYSYCIQKC